MRWLIEKLFPWVAPFRLTISERNTIGQVIAGEKCFDCGSPKRDQTVLKREDY